MATIRKRGKQQYYVEVRKKGWPRQYAVSLHGGIRLVFEPANIPVPCHDEGGINWLRVTKVRIIYIGDYHD
ncbi:MAG: hypothetical protein HON68_10265 [Gammaproteobacteria bacterium]|jgi:proteic killer suppression protein|nr:hypothetical protein [Gammaproteobacteria bacterium]MBT3489602.1 hypothetical protein [Gammaproteobacteria bacterium]MBT3719086.1 hypothetical protein [Gammaproteobacteria bacterium]MBT3843961.1 hypothetical protein [Gammaproteobacteria bacterium]MBT3892127.1 hypothetical protein [Gammaproteobacteria bacterium]